MANIKCTNGSTHYHTSVAESRACYGVSLQAQDDRLEQFKANVAEPLESALVPASSLAEINAEQETWPWTYRKGQDKHPMDLGRRYAETLAETGLKPDEPTDEMTVAFAEPSIAPERTERYQTAYPLAGRPARGTATDPMKRYVAALVSERDLTKLTDERVREITIRVDVQGTDGLSFEDAKLVIPALKDLPRKSAAKAEPKEQPWRKLSREVPAGNYKITDEAGKNRFYRVSVGRNDFYKLQERASEELHFIPLSRYAGILQAILEAGVEAARLAYAQDQTRCWHCNTKLTDNTGNPHYGRGLGPHCGEEH